MKYLSLFTGICTLTLSACSSHVTEYSHVKNVPTVTSTSMSSILACSAQVMQNYESDVAFVVLVREVVDGTIRKVSSLDGPLADAGANQLKGRLNMLMPTENGLVVDQYPLMFKTFYGRSLSDNFGTPSRRNLALYRQQMLKLINTRRQLKGLKPVNTLALISLDGSFTRLDSSAFADRGQAINGGAEGRNNRRSGDIELGRSQSGKVVSLLTNMIRPDMNLVVRSESMDLVFNNDTSRFNLKSQFGDGRLGWSFSKSKIESLHSAQQTLIDASALWVMSELFKDAGLKERCFPQEKSQNQSVPQAAQPNETPSLPKNPSPTTQPDSSPEQPMTEEAILPENTAAPVEENPESYEVQAVKTVVEPTTATIEAATGYQPMPKTQELQASHSIVPTSDNQAEVTQLAAKPQFSEPSVATEYIVPDPIEVVEQPQGMDTEQITTGNTSTDVIPVEATQPSETALTEPTSEELESAQVVPSESTFSTEPAAEYVEPSVTALNQSQAVDPESVEAKPVKPEPNKPLVEVSDDYIYKPDAEQELPSQDQVHEHKHDMDIDSQPHVSTHHDIG